MNRRKLKKAILAEALRLHEHSHRFPVRRFTIEVPGGKVTSREFEGGYGVVDELIRLCDELRAGR